MANILRTASVWLKGAIICFAIGLLLFIIGFATTSWVVYRSRNYYRNNGLWQTYACPSNYHCQTYTYGELNGKINIHQYKCKCLTIFGLGILTVTCCSVTLGFKSHRCKIEK